MDADIIKILENAMDLDDNSITPEDVLEDMDEWDSISKLSFVAYVKEKMGKQISIMDVSRFVTVQDAIDFFEKE